MGRWATVAGLVMTMLASTRLAFACPVCFGTEDASANRAIEAGIVVMLGVVAAVLLGVALFAIRLCRGAAASAHLDATDGATAHVPTLNGGTRC